LNAEVSTGPGRGILVHGGKGSKQLSFPRARDVAGWIGTQVEDELALVVGELVWKLECDERGDIFTTVLVEARDEVARHMEIDGARGDGVLAGEVWKNRCDGLLALRLGLDAGGC
jgi:hypothetical protein